jgi:hypothetical protein
MANPPRRDKCVTRLQQCMAMLHAAAIAECPLNGVQFVDFRHAIFLP